jgi:hypothetical protein
LQRSQNSGKRSADTSNFVHFREECRFEQTAPDQHVILVLCASLEHLAQKLLLRTDIAR